MFKHAKIERRSVPHNLLLFAASNTMVRSKSGGVVQVLAGEEIMARIAPAEIEGSKRLYFVHRADDPSDIGAQTVTAKIRAVTAQHVAQSRASALIQARAKVEGLRALQARLNDQISEAERASGAAAA